jgi:hypothetical protein
MNRWSMNGKGGGMCLWRDGGRDRLRFKWASDWKPDTVKKSTSLNVTVRLK